MAQAFTAAESSYLSDQALARLATATPTGRPHVVPVSFTLDKESETIHIGAHVLPGRGQSRLYHRHIENNPVVALVIDDLVSTNPWTPRGIQIRGRAEIVAAGGERLAPGFGPIWVRVSPSWITSWGIETAPFEPPHSRAAAASET
ncbi:PPOX class F420-dependent oxidoreductase [Mycobacterium sp. DBP42]|uniref:PPOX class F420-dependent oxidoreductase n=1 Tax=Mycobacterium sp. DBP42 TaxID=2545267 RepID=UPI00110D0878|nr:PPOX class F420-dependent oxidoreductase [Mycobacterium sp. DBP42]TMS51161.1 PPOX class F420-dependent oxidoreductase [Mycobacterium sp. DBP42]